MEFAGKTLEDLDVQYGKDLADRLMGSELLSSEQMKAEINLVRAEIDGAIDHKPDAAASFILWASDACESGQYRRNVYDFGRVATLVATKIVAKDPELGKRLLHDILTRHNTEFSNGVWAEIQSQYEAGKLTYDDFNKFFLVRHLH